MLNNLRKHIENEQEHDFIAESMIAGTDSMAELFIEDDGEAEIPESEIVSILNKIPAYDEEEELSKKLSKITESYIPEEL